MTRKLPAELLRFASVTALAATVILGRMGDASAADVEEPEVSDKTRIRFGDSLFVELTAVSDSAGETFWKQNGDATDEQFSISQQEKNVAANAGERLRRLIARGSLPTGFSLRFEVGESGISRNLANANEKTHSVEFVSSATVKLPKNAATTDVRLIVTSPVWTTLAKFDGGGGHQNGVLMKPIVVNRSKPRHVEVSLPFVVEDENVVRIRSANLEHKFLDALKMSVSKSTVPPTLLTADFERRDERPMKYFVQQRMPGVAIVFHNVSLESDRQSRVTAEIEYPDGRKQPIDFGIKSHPLSLLSSIPPTKWRAPLDENGSYAELIGITDYSEPEPWWYPDGSTSFDRRKPWFAQMKAAADDNESFLEVAWRIDVPGDADDAAISISTRGCRFTQSKKSESPSGRTEILITQGLKVDSFTDKVDSTVRVAWGPWEGVGEKLAVKDVPYDPPSEYFRWASTQKDVEISETYVFLRKNNTSGYDSVHLVFSEDEAMNYRLVLEGESGKRQTHLLTAGSRNVRMIVSKDLPKVVTAYRLESRPFRTATFRQVSLWKQIPTSASVDSSVSRAAEEKHEPVSAEPSYVFRTPTGTLLLRPENADLAKRVETLQQRGAVLKFGRVTSGVKDRPTLKDVQQLNRINVRNLAASDLHLLAGIAGVSELAIGTDGNSRHLTVLETLPDLRDLEIDCDETDLTVFEVFGRLTDLRRLSIRTSFNIGRRGFSADHFEPISQLKDLEAFAGNDIDLDDEMLRHLSNAKRLNRLHAGNCPNVTDAGLAHLADLKNLSMLRLYRNQATDDGLRHLAKLTSMQWLEIPSENFTDDAIQHLAKMTKLYQLDLSKCQITDEGAKQLVQHRHLQDLQLHGTKVSNNGAEFLRKVLPRANIRIQ